MKNQLTIYLFAILLVIVSCNCDNKQANESELLHDKKDIAADPLPSWNEGSTKQAIKAYMRQITDSGTASYIPVQDRIATFDNDGTLWAERPYVQELFAMYRAKEMVAKKPELARQQPFKAVMQDDKSYFTNGGMKAVMQLVNATHTGMTEDDFEVEVKNFFAKATYPPRNTPIRNIVYQPQQELLHFLRENGFNIYICTGGTIEFVRGISQEFYGVPKSQVIGSTFKYKFIDSNHSIIREAAIANISDKERKPVAIQEHIGQRPVFACGNEGGAGDIAMLEYSQGGKYPSFQMLINHDDSTKEYYYQEKDNASLKAAAKNGWHVVSIKNDWKTVFPMK